MSQSTLRNNFYRIATLIIDHGADVMRSLLDQFIRKKYNSLKDFVSKNQHELYHQFKYDICCQCPRHYQRPDKQHISSRQMDTLFETNGPKLSCHKPNSKCEFCCSDVKPNLQISDLDITLLKFFLVTYFEEEFWRNCLTDGLSFHDFLNSNKHDIFHLVQLNVPCCLCMKNPDYTIIVATCKDRLNKSQWEAMFATTDQCSAHNETCVAYRNPCSVSATIGFNLLSLNRRARMIILSKFCIMMKHIDQLVHARNTVFAHAIKGELSDDDFRKLWKEIENSILYLSKITNTDLERTQRIAELSETLPEEAICLEIQLFALQQMRKDEHIIQETQHLQQKVENVESMVEEINAKLVQDMPLLKTNVKTPSNDIQFNKSHPSGNSGGYEYAPRNKAKKRCSVGYNDDIGFVPSVVYTIPFNFINVTYRITLFTGFWYNMSNTTGATCGAGSIYHYGAHEITPSFWKCCSMVGGLLLVGVPLVMLIIGVEFMHACPAEIYIPIYLVVAAVTFVPCFMAQTVYYEKDAYKEQKFKVNPVIWFINGSLLAWFIAGNVWVYRIHGNFSTDAAHQNFCNPTLYWFSFWLITSTNILISVILFIVCVIKCVSYRKR